MSSPSGSSVASSRSGSPGGGAGSPASQVTAAASQFKAEISALCQHAKYLVQVGTMIGSTPSGGKFVFSESRVPGVAGPANLGRKELKVYLSLFVAKIKGLNKLYREKPKGGKKRAGNTRTGEQLKALFYVSSQLVNFIKKSNLGTCFTAFSEELTVQESGRKTKKGKDILEVVCVRGDSTDVKMSYADLLKEPASDETSMHAVLEKLLYKKGLATSAIFTSVMGLVHRVNPDLARDSTDIKTYFGGKTTTEWQVGGVGVGAIQPAADDAALTKKFNEYTDNKNKSGLTRLGPVDGVLSYSQLMKLANFYRIPTKLARVDAEPLVDEDNIQMAAAVQEILHNHKVAQEWANGPQKAMADRAKRAAAKRAKAIE